MKKGCFIKTLLIVTVLIAALIYWVQKYGEKFFSEQGKRFAASFIIDDLKDKLQFAKNSPQKDSLKSLLDSTLFINEKFSDLSEEEWENIAVKFDLSFSDSVINSTELREMNILINERIRK